MGLDYEATWGAGYVSQGTRRVSIDFFNAENGYNEEDIEVLRGLKPGDVWGFDDLSGHHTVKKLEGETMETEWPESKAPLKYYVRDGIVTINEDGTVNIEGKHKRLYTLREVEASTTACGYCGTNKCVCEYDEDGNLKGE